MHVIIVPILLTLNTIINIYVNLIIASVIMSWLVAFNIINTRNKFVYNISYFLDRITEPAYRKIRKYINLGGGIDISPMILLLGLFLVQNVFAEMIFSFR